VPEWVRALPHLNATLNTVSLGLILAGWRFVRRKNVAAHRACMLSALGAATLFLISYVIYHSQAGSTKFTGEGWVRPVYFFILITHIVLAAGIVPLAIVTARRGVRNDVERHRRIARWTLPIWIYVSVTGLLVYGFIYIW
jgi:putative membrane protein